MLGRAPTPVEYLVCCYTSNTPTLKFYCGTIQCNGIACSFLTAFERFLRATPAGFLLPLLDVGYVRLGQDLIVVGAPARCEELL